MKTRVAANMHFINNAFVKTVGRTLFAFPIKNAVHHHRFRHVRGAVQIVKRQILVGAVRIVAEYRLVADKSAGKLATIGVKQQFVVVETIPLFRTIGAVNAVTVYLPGFYPRHINMPDIVVVAVDEDARNFFGAVFVKQTQFHLFGMGGKKRKIYPLAVIMRAERIGFSRLCFNVIHRLFP